MKFFTGCVLATGLVLVATAAQAQVAASDGADRGAFAGAVHTPATGTHQPCGRGLSRACMIEKNLAWSELGQYRCLNYGAFPAQGLQRKPGGFELQEVQARPFLRDVERPGLNLRNRGSRRTSGGPVGAANAQGAPMTVKALT